jgi:aspartokinase/homoserine dehydrogenase 1
MKPKWIVHKFGGTSVANAECYRRVANILISKNTNDVNTAVVVSAMSKTTDSLIELVKTAVKRDSAYEAGLRALRKRHLDTVDQLELSEDLRSQLSTVIESDCADLADLLRGVWLARSYSERVLELVSGYGEVWSAQLLRAHLESCGEKASWLDARETLIVEPNGRSVTIDWERSRARLNGWLETHPCSLAVITGFVASTPEGIPTTLKRNGSDFSASIFGALLRATEITIWTDVDGVFSADPRLVPDAVLTQELSYQEASELAYFGAKVVHPSTMAPAIADGIPIWIRNTFKPNAPGTRICGVAPADGPVKGFATVEQMALVNVEGTGMIGVPGIAHRLFGALRDIDVSVVMISQASSEHSICLAVPESEAALVKGTLESAFFAEIHRGQIQSIGVVTDSCIIAAVGEGMIEHPGVAAKFFGALAKAGVNIRAIAQGSSERNISAVIAQSEATRALRAVHSAFYLSPQTISIGMIGAGLIGKTLLNQLAERADVLKAERGIDLRVRGIANSRKMILDDLNIDLLSWENAMNESSTPADLEKFVDHIRASHLPHTVIIDATSSATVPHLYPEWLRNGINIITPNKKGNTQQFGLYTEIKEAARKAGRYYLYETTVGAGLPILHTLRDLIETGDEVLQIEGVLSGTLSFVFNSFDGKRPFSEILSEARALGYTEPDPRDDLSGMDVARKLTILAREMGLDLELSDIEVENLVPAALRERSVDEFLHGIQLFDDEMKDRLTTAASCGEVLRYVGIVDHSGRASVKLGSYPASHPLGGLTGSDNLVMFTTARYNKQPMVVRGPGAGPEVTAAGVFADLLRLASFLGAPQ